MPSGIGLTAIYAAMAVASAIGVGTLLLAFIPYRLKIEGSADTPRRLKIEKSATPRKERWSKANTILLTVCGVIVTGGAHLAVSGTVNGTGQGSPHRPHMTTPRGGGSPRTIGDCQPFGDGSSHNLIRINDPRAYDSVHDEFHVRGFVAPHSGEVSWLLICVAKEWQVLSDQPLRTGKGYFSSPPIYTDGADKGGIYQDCVVLVTSRGAQELIRTARRYPHDYIASPPGIEQHECVDLRYWPPTRT